MGNSTPRQKPRAGTSVHRRLHLPRCVLHRCPVGEVTGNGLRGSQCCPGAERLRAPSLARAAGQGRGRGAGLQPRRPVRSTRFAVSHGPREHIWASW